MINKTLFLWFSDKFRDSKQIIWGKALFPLGTFLSPKRFPTKFVKEGFFLAFLFMSNAFSQDAEDLIRHSLHNYFNGTSYNYIPQIKSAFYPEAELYLENREGDLWKINPDEYVALFAKNEPGKFGGRYSKILSIDIEGNLALVKAEILYPKINKRFIDVFIMKEVEENSWLIISKAANSSPMK